MSTGVAAGEVERLHPFFLLTGIGRGLRGLTGAYALVAYFAVSGQLWLGLTIAVGLLVAAIVSAFVYWRCFEFRVGADDIQIDSGVLSRTHRSIPFDRIQDVDITQGPLSRILGLAKVTFETGGGSAQSGKEDGVIHAITLQRAGQLRELVRARRSAAGPAMATVEEAAEGKAVYAMRLPRLLLAGLFNFSLALFAGLLGLSKTVGDFLNFDPFSRSFWDRVLSASDPVRSYVLAHQIVTAIAGVVVLVIVGLLTGTIRTVARDYGFRLDRTGVGLRRRRGLFTRTDVTLPTKRAQAAILASGPVRDGFGFSELKLQNLAGDEDKSGNHVLAPLATGDEANQILSALGWRELPDPVEWKRVSTSFVWSFLLGVAPFIIAGAAAQVVFVPLLGFAWLAVPFALWFGRRLEWRRIGYALDGDRLLIRSGWWRRRTTVLPLSKIQSIDLRESFVTRWFGTASLQFGVAGGTALAPHSIPAIPREGARQLRDRLLGLQP
ncbi:MAG TPA: PH domain-containing protein [Sphingomicrobium sp.]|nr:PH domain-containing protein [Sphingomicrobium sp.]